MRSKSAALVALILVVAACGQPGESVGATVDEAALARALEAELSATDSASAPAAATDSGAVVMSSDDAVTNLPVGGEARDDVASTMAGSAIGVGVLVNDGAGATLLDVFEVVGGTAAIGPDGSVTFTPSAGFSGEGGFWYTVSYADGSNRTAHATVMVIAPRAAPNGGDDTAFTLQETVVFIDVLANDSDADSGDTLSIQSVSDAGNGNTAIVGGEIRYRPANGFYGDDTFTYVVRSTSADEKVVETDTATVTVTVDGVPTATNDSDSALAGETITIDVQANDSDPEGEALTTVSVTTPDSGSATINGDGTIDYTAPAGFSGTATFDYTIEDPHGQSSTATVTVDVNGPPEAVDDCDEPNDIPIIQTVNVLTNDSDPDGDAITLVSVTATSNNIVINFFTADGDVNYTYTGGGDGTFDYTIEDSNGLSDSAMVTIPESGTC
jgi:hypothetical protein